MDWGKEKRGQGRNVDDRMLTRPTARSSCNLVLKKKGAKEKRITKEKAGQESSEKKIYSHLS